MAEEYFVLKLVEPKLNEERTSKKRIDISSFRLIQKDTYGMPGSKKETDEGEGEETDRIKIGRRRHCTI